jgi:hypothetical protein
MIVRRRPDSSLCITQPDHAALAGHLMRHWQAGGLPHSLRREDILRAIDEHDNGWREVDAAPIVDPAGGAVLDFVGAPLEMRQGVWPRGVRRLADTPYTAALVANHAVHVFSRFRGRDDWTPFFDTMTTLRGEMLAASGLPLETLLADYAFLRIGDLLSLTFCNEWTEPQGEFACDIRLDGTRLLVSPDPFGGRLVPFEIAAREIPSHALSSPHAAAAAWSDARHITLSGIAAGR